MAETKTATLTHKVRNPQDLDKWLDIWEAEVSAEYDESNNRNNEVVTITPSNDWKIPTNNIIGTIPVDQIIMENTAAEGQNPNNQNVIIRTDQNGNLIAGPIIDSEGSATQFLNEQGNWVSIMVDRGLSIVNSAIGHSNSINISEQTNELNYDEDEGQLSIPFINFDAQGHITSITTKTLDITVKGSHITGEGLLDVSVINSDDLDAIIRSKTNTKSTAGVVAAGNKNRHKAWATDDDGNPAWRTGQISIPNKYITSTSQTFLRGFSDLLEDSCVMLIEDEDDDYKIIFKGDNAIINSSLATDGNYQHNISYEVFYEEE